MISKELYEEVQKDYIDFKNITQDEYIIIFNKEEETVEYVNKHTWYEADSISIYKLAHRCKEWALTNKYKIVIYSDDSSEWYCQVQLVDVDKQPKEWSVAQTEPGSTFKACQWILDNKEIKWH